MSISRRHFLTHASAAAALSVVGGRSARSLAFGDGAAHGRAEKAPFPYVDGLSFLGPDAPLSASGLSGVIWDVSDIEPVKEVPAGTAPRFVRSFDACARSITAKRRTLSAGKIPGGFLATRGSDIRKAYDRGETAVFFQFQGADPLGDDLRRLDLFYELGLRILQITHHNNNAWGGGALEREAIGLTKLGAEGVERLNTLGIIPDLAHVGDVTALDVLKISKKPVIVSHGGARALVNNARCTPDSVIKGVADSGGMMGIFMMSFWLTEDPVPNAESYLRQIAHVIKVGGIDAVGIANDFGIVGVPAANEPGMTNEKMARGYDRWWNGVANEGILGFDKRPMHVVIPELNDVRRTFKIHAALERAGYKAAEIEKIMGGNWIRVLTSTLG